MLSSSLISIPKDPRASLCKSTNYRSIALSSAICKVIDIIILFKCSKELTTSDLQFGFKKCHSTALCTTVFKEIVYHYVNRGSNVYAVLLDASKAFDNVHFGRLFKLLIKRKVPMIVIRFLLDCYTRQDCSVFWNGSRSNVFKICNGVKQGGVLSPVLFTVYIDSLLSLLSSSKFGCSVNGCFTGALCYADDLTLLSPSLTGLNSMLNICLEFAQEYCVTFNERKTVAIYFGSKEVSGYVQFNGIRLDWKCKAKYLGNIITSPLSDNSDCMYKRSSFIGSVNKLIANFDHVSYSLKCKLFSTFCTSFYCSTIWNLDCKDINALCTAWQKAVRRLLGLPYTAHSWALGPLVKSLHIRTVLELRNWNFLRTLCTSTNSVLREIFLSACEDARSDLGHNIAHFRSAYSLHVWNDSHKFKSTLSALPLTPEQEIQISVALDVLFCLHNDSDNGLDHESNVDILRDVLCD